MGRKPKHAAIDDGQDDDDVADPGGMLSEWQVAAIYGVNIWKLRRYVTNNNIAFMPTYAYNGKLLYDAKLICDAMIDEAMWIKGRELAKLLDVRQETVSYVVSKFSLRKRQGKHASIRLDDELTQYLIDRHIAGARGKMQWEIKTRRYSVLSRFATANRLPISYQDEWKRAQG